MESQGPHAHRFFPALDGIRGIASLLVVLRHISPFFGDIHFVESYLAVDIFFVLSGVVLAGAYQQRLQQDLPPARFVWIRVVRIYPLYLVGVVISLLCILLQLGVPPGSQHWYLTLPLALALLPNLLPFGHPNPFPFNPPSWSLFIELWGNIVYGGLARILSRRILLAIIVASAVALIGALYLNPFHDLNIGFTQRGLVAGAVRFGYSFFAGVFVYRLYVAQGSPTLSGRRSLAALGAVFLAITFLLTCGTADFVRPFYDLAAVTLVFPAIIYGALWIAPTGIANTACKFLGAISYPVYAIHAPLGNAVNGILQAYFGISVRDHAPLSGLIFLALLVPLCWALNTYYDTRVRRLLHRWIERAPQSSAQTH